jgi:hypothetical protein
MVNSQPVGEQGQASVVGEQYASCVVGKHVPKTVILRGVHPPADPQRGGKGRIFRVL